MHHACIHSQPVEQCLMCLDAQSPGDCVVMMCLIARASCLLVASKSGGQQLMAAQHVATSCARFMLQHC